MNPIDRIREYKRLATLLRDTGDSNAAAALREMCDEDKKLDADKHAAGLSELELQARQYITTITAWYRPGARDSAQKIDSKASDILLEVAYFEQCVRGEGNPSP